MTEEEKVRMWNKIDMEGFDYFFLHYFSYERWGVKDAKLKKLSDNFAKAANTLRDYIKPKGEE